MKKLIILMTLFLLCNSLFPAQFLAADTEKDTTQESASSDDEYNEFGIKKGTMVHGEDISELSEEELQYIPEGWRDGVVEDVHGHAEGEHEEEAPEGAMSRAATYPNVNDYIVSKKFTTAKIEYDYKSVFPKMNYRSGYAKVEGVVAHETANDSSTITGEISYMTRNYQNAFVHAFVDHQRIIEIHPTGYSVWGAGRYGNQRFAQVELVRVHTFDNFARSIDNYASYIASVLYKYKLGVSSAETKGSGTLWSHAAISKFLGGTNHSDPHGYFAKYGYNWSEFTELVTAKYKKLAGTTTPVTPVAAPKEVATSKLGHLKSSSAKIYSKLSSTASTSAGTTNLNEVFYIKKEATVGSTKYYLISQQPSATTGVVGWVKSTDITVQTHSTVDKNAKIYYIKGTGSAYTKPWGGTGDYYFKSLAASAGVEFKVNMTEKVGSTTWYRGVANGRTIWIEAKNVVSSVEKAVSKLGHIKSSTVKIYPDLTKLSSTITAGTTYTNTVYYIKKEVLLHGTTYYLLSKNPSSTTGVVGWAKATDVTAQTHATVDKKAKTFYALGTGSAYTKVWGGSKDFYFQKLVVSSGREFKVNLTEKVGSTIWYQGVLNGKTVWIEAKNVSAAKTTATSKIGQIESSKVKIYKDLNNLSSTAAAGTTYTNKAYYIKQKAVLNGVSYYLLSNSPSATTGVVGWVKTSDMKAHTHTTIDKKAKTFYIKGTGSSYTKAWGRTNDISVKSLKTFKNKPFEVKKTEKVGASLWYYGVLDGKSMWIRYSLLSSEGEAQKVAVSSVKKTATSKIGQIESSKVKIYKDLNNLSSTAAAGTTYTNKAYYIKQKAVLNGVSYYLLSTSPSITTGVVGWVKTSDMKAHTHKAIDKTAKTLYITGRGSSYTKAWGRTNDISVKSLKTFKNKPFEVKKTEKVGASLWYYGVLDGKSMWIRYSLLSSEGEAQKVAVSSVKKTATSKIGQIESSKVKIYKDLNNLSSTVTAGKTYTNKAYYIKQKAVLNGVSYYLLSSKPSITTGVVGWVKTSDMKAHTHKAIDKTAKTLYITGRGSSYTKAWGRTNDISVKSLKTYKNKPFKVKKTEKVGASLWYYGVLDGKSMWIRYSLLKK
ncbi:N-acetylmuramoyl-L-alanine amidase family protein [Planomicrobium sp. CPCC 101110]|uniref:peptidoglycan recognition protein family protein n=1 Tax=Planomicrobium sp. CPCC 101110 TaxID=2599619 RepID=UPI0011B3C93C|nr:GW dipeptide domain-containing protein [Planomicrobium sp. CPCC 101110]TWT27699.1 hypothetical protein FQV30_04065 [Planomicrobium sp. CPCC 101110]